MIKNNPVLVYLTTFVLAACSILYELLIAQTISSLAAQTVLWYSLTIGLYLLAMGAGVLCYSRIFPEDRPGWDALGKVELILSIVGAAIVLVLSFAHMLMSYLWVREQFYQGSALFFVSAFLISFAVGFLSGLELPLLISIAKHSAKEKSIINRVLSADYFGSLVGAVLFPICLLPYFSLVVICLSVALINLWVAIIIVFRSTHLRPQIKGGAIAFLIVLLFCLAKSKDITQYFLKKYYYYIQETIHLQKLISLPVNYPDIEHTLSLYQGMDLVKAPDRPDPFYYLPFAYSKKYKRATKDYPIDYLFYMNRSFQFWLNFEEIYHEYFVHAPIHYLRRVPKRVLVLGAGDGLLLRELLKYPNVKDVTLVDIDKKMIDMARNHSVFRKINRDAFKDSRVHVVIDDAYQYVRQDDQLYDAIFMDFPDPANYDISKLYSKEFYAFVLKLLKRHGFVVVNIPQMGEKKEDVSFEMQTLYNTFNSAGYGMIKPFVARLETDNLEAKYILKKIFGGVDEVLAKESSIISGESRQKVIKGEDAIFNQVIADFSHDYQQQFIIAAREEMPTFHLFAESAIEMDILNAYRFFLAFSDDNIHLTALPVNSIMKPTMPNLKYWWRLKLPY